MGTWTEVGENVRSEGGAFLEEAILLAGFGGWGRGEVEGGGGGSKGMV